ncbi:Dolichyl-phosphate-mannose-protein mannosyltransferase [Actinobacteria bacterium IMCC26207]|nr:Dolichyl-phosphate-mannose-protein mannosyltransferase [Actinobacteria bacterium IMCC26207]
MERVLPNVVLVLLLVLVGGVWLFGAFKDLPYVSHPDEPTNLRVVDQMVESKDLNPHFFNYPSLFLYLHAAVNLDGPLLDSLGQELPPMSQVMGTSKTETPGSVRVHRTLSVLLGLLAIFASYMSSLLLTGRRWVSLWAAILMASSITLTVNARIITPDVLAVALVSGTLWASLRVLRNPTWSAHLLAGLAAGLAASSKYNAVLVVTTVAVASVLSGSLKADLAGNRRRALPQRALKLALAGFGACAAFALTTPFSWLDRPEFLRDLQFERQHYATGHAGMDGNAASWYVNYFSHSELLIIAASGLGLCIALICWRWKELAVLLAFPLTYWALIASQSVRNERTALLLLPSLAVLATYGLGLAGDQLRYKDPAWHSSWIRALGILISTLAITVQVVHLRPSLNLQKTTSTQAREWVDGNVDRGTPILVESYSPWIDSAQYQVTAIPTLAAMPNPTSWDYVIASDAMYRRFLDNEARFPREVAVYRSLFSSLRTVAEFNGNGPRIRIMAKD